MVESTVDLPGRKVSQKRGAASACFIVLTISLNLFFPFRA